MFPIIGTLHLTIGTEWLKKKAHIIIVVEIITLQISRILVMRPRLIRPRRIAQIIGVVVDEMVDTAVDAMVDAKVNTRSGETIRGIRIEMFMEMVFKIGAILVCNISFVRTVDGMPPILLDFIPLGSVILSIFPCLLTMIIGNCQGRLFVSKLALEPIWEVEWEINPNAVWIFLK